MIRSQLFDSFIYVNICSMLLKLNNLWSLALTIVKVCRLWIFHYFIKYLNSFIIVMISLKSNFRLPYHIFRNSFCASIIAKGIFSHTRCITNYSFRVCISMTWIVKNHWCLIANINQCNICECVGYYTFILKMFIIMFHR